MNSGSFFSITKTANVGKSESLSSLRESQLKPPPFKGGAWALTTSGEAFDLVSPNEGMVHWGDIAHALAKICRFNGHTPGRFYTVAQHCVVGADYLAARVGLDAALAFLLHDAHEALIGDIPTPVMHALIAVANAEFVNRAGYPAGEVVKSSIKTLKFNLDTVIYRAARVAWPLTAEMKQLVKQVDASLLVTERARLMPQNRYLWGEAVEQHPPLPIRKGFEPLSFADAELLWLDRLQRYAPHLKGIRHGR